MSILDHNQNYDADIEDYTPPGKFFWFCGYDLNYNEETWHHDSAKKNKQQFLNGHIEPDENIYDTPDVFESIDVFETSPDVYEAPADVYETPVDLYETPVDVYEAPVDVYEAPVDSSKLLYENIFVDDSPAHEDHVYETPAVIPAPSLDKNGTYFKLNGSFIETDSEEEVRAIRDGSLYEEPSPEYEEIPKRESTTSEMLSYREEDLPATPSNEMSFKEPIMASGTWFLFSGHQPFELAHQTIESTSYSTDSKEDEYELSRQSDEKYSSEYLGVHPGYIRCQSNELADVEDGEQEDGCLSGGEHSREMELEKTKHPKEAYQDIQLDEQFKMLDQLVLESFDDLAIFLDNEVKEDAQKSSEDPGTSKPSMLSPKSYDSEDDGKASPQPRRRPPKKDQTPQIKPHQLDMQVPPHLKAYEVSNEGNNYEALSKAVLSEIRNCNDLQEHVNSPPSVYEPTVNEKQKSYELRSESESESRNPNRISQFHSDKVDSNQNRKEFPVNGDQNAQKLKDDNNDQAINVNDIFKEVFADRVLQESLESQPSENKREHEEEHPTQINNLPRKNLPKQTSISITVNPRIKPAIVVKTSQELPERVLKQRVKCSPLKKSQSFHYIPRKKGDQEMSFASKLSMFKSIDVEDKQSKQTINSPTQKHLPREIVHKTIQQSSEKYSKERHSKPPNSESPKQNRKQFPKQTKSFNLEPSKQAPKSVDSKPESEKHARSRQVQKVPLLDKSKVFQVLPSSNLPEDKKRQQENMKYEFNTYLDNGDKGHFIKAYLDDNDSLERTNKPIDPTMKPVESSLTDAALNQSIEDTITPDRLADQLAELEWIGLDELSQPQVTQSQPNLKCDSPATPVKISTSEMKDETRRGVHVTPTIRSMKRHHHIVSTSSIVTKMSDSEDFDYTSGEDDQGFGFKRNQSFRKSITIEDTEGGLRRQQSTGGTCVSVFFTPITPASNTVGAKDGEKTICQQYKEILTYLDHMIVSVGNFAQDFEVVKKMHSLFWELKSNEKSSKANENMLSVMNYLVVQEWPKIMLGCLKKLKTGYPHVFVECKDIENTIYYSGHLPSLLRMNRTSPEFALSVLFDGLLKAAVNFTDVHEASRIACCEDNLIGYLLHDIVPLLRNIHWGKVTAREMFLKSTCDLVYNCAQAANNAAYLIDNQCVNLLTELREVTSDIVDARKVNMSMLLSLSFLIDNNNYDLIISTEDSVIRLLQFLDKSLEHSEHNHHDFTAEELASCIGRLAGHDHNKVLITRNSGQEILVKLLKYAYTDGERVAALHSIWNLAFNHEAKDILRGMGKLKHLLNDLKTSQNPIIRRAANGILWECEEKYDIKGLRESPSSTPHHVMITYEYEAQPLVIGIRDELHRNGYKVWMNTDGDERTLHEIMTRGVEQATVVIAAVTRKYKQCPYTFAEIDYAHTLRKTIIPIIIDNDYVPDGWLSEYVHTMKTFDFSRFSMFNGSLDALLEYTNEIVERKTGSGTNILVDKAIVVRSRSTDILTWTNDDVIEWLQENQLIKSVSNTSRLRKLTGLHLLMFFDLKKESPDYFYSALDSHIGFKDVLDTLEFTYALDRLLCSERLI